MSKEVFQKAVIYLLCRILERLTSSEAVAIANIEELAGVNGVYFQKKGVVR